MWTALRWAFFIPLPDITLKIQVEFGALDVPFWILCSTTQNNLDGGRRGSSLTSC